MMSWYKIKNYTVNIILKLTLVVLFFTNIKIIMMLKELGKIGL